MNVMTLPSFISRRAQVPHLHPRLVTAGTNAEERDPVAVPRIHVGLDLEHEAGERGLAGCDDPAAAVAGLWRRCPVDQRLQDFLHAEVVDPGAEEDRRLPAGEKRVERKRRARAADEIDVAADRRHLVRKQRIEPRIVEAGDELGVLAHPFLARREPAQVVAEEVEHAAKMLAHADRPAHGRAVDLQHRLDFLQQFDRLAHLAIHLVDEGDDRCRAQPADVEQLDRLLLDALGGVDDHDRGVDGGQHAVGVLRKILVAGRVEQVDRMPGVVELHHRARHRDAALFLDFHPVRGGVTGALPRLDGAREQDRAAEQQQLFGQRRLAGVGVGNDRKGAPASDIAFEIGSKRGFGHEFCSTAREVAFRWAGQEMKNRRPGAAGGRAR
jgi:hypothetical protein